MYIQFGDGVILSIIIILLAQSSPIVSAWLV